MEIIIPRFARPKGKRWSPTVGKGVVYEPDGTIAWEGEWVPNTLMDEGEQDILNVWLLQGSDLAKYLCLLTSAPAETDTMAVLATKEVYTPPLNGYARIQVANTDWATPTLVSGDYKTTAAQKTFGPASSNAWASLTHAGLVSAATGQASGSGKFLLYVPLSGTTTVAIGQSFGFAISASAS